MTKHSMALVTAHRREIRNNGAHDHEHEGYDREEISRVNRQPRSKDNLPADLLVGFRWIQVGDSHNDSETQIRALLLWLHRPSAT
jgi:hypothetical protein